MEKNEEGQLQYLRSCRARVVCVSDRMKQVHAVPDNPVFRGGVDER